VSIVTPSYNTGAFIEETLRSVEQQHYPRVEHIVLDSGSTDGSLDILARHPAVRLITPAPQGISDKMNLGFSKARGDIVCWLNADDCLLPGAIAKAVDALKRNPDVGLVYCNSMQVDERSVEIGRTRNKQATLREMLRYNYIQGAFVRREVLELVGPIDTRYPLVQDWDWLIRISKQFPTLWVDDWWSANRVQSRQRSQLYMSEVWLQTRAMTQQHGAPFLPLFWSYWGPKFLRAGRMLLTGQFSRFHAKLRTHITSFERSREARKGHEY
jgi:glycosyltransferase involved in cell wall biosynthesis